MSDRNSEAAFGSGVTLSAPAEQEWWMHWATQEILERLGHAELRADADRQHAHRLGETIYDLQEALTWADDYLGALDDEGARVVRRKIQEAWPQWMAQR